MDDTRSGFRYYDDFAEGEVIDLGSYAVTAEEIIEFAEEFDPAPFHLSEEGGRASLLGRLSASGWHTCAMTMRMLYDHLLANSSGQGSPGIDEARWLAPVVPGDTLTGRATVLSRRLSASRPGIGLVRFRFDYFTEGDKPVLTMVNSIMFAARDTAGAEPAR
ncbi:MAG: enoyl-CoA hydratase [Alphaproteobacteria bacterium]|nr:MAG: enoyl-CoA hydratase [Alphaproteobacteria bacterium]